MWTTTYTSNDFTTAGDWFWSFRDDAIARDPVAATFDFLDEFYEALKRCHDALAALIRPLLRALLRPSACRRDDDRGAFDLIFPVPHRPRPRAIVSRDGFRNFHKVRA